MFQYYKRLDTDSKNHKKFIQSMRGNNYDNNCNHCDTNKEIAEELNDNFDRMFEIMKDQNKFIGILRNSREK